MKTWEKAMIKVTFLFKIRMKRHSRKPIFCKYNEKTEMFYI